jgi:hypothetical protein
VAKPKSSKRDRLLEILAALGISSVGEGDVTAIRSALAPISDSYLRKLLRSAEIPLAPLVEGVRQESFDQLERTLLALLGEYEAGDHTRQMQCRRAVIEAKDHARFAARKAVEEARKAEKEEMVLWMITWLENPAVFREWVDLRRKVLATEPESG